MRRLVLTMFAVSACVSLVVFEVTLWAAVVHSSKPLVNAAVAAGVHFMFQVFLGVCVADLWKKETSR